MKQTVREKKVANKIALFLNSLTAKDMCNLGHKCEILFPTSDDIDINKLKDMKKARRGSKLGLVREG